MTKIAIVGSPGSGKTVLLSVLTSLKNVNFEPRNDITAGLMNRWQNSLNSGNWNEKTSHEQGKELSWRVRYGTSMFLLQTNDFPGESWKEFIGKYGDEGGVIDSSQNDKLESFLDQSEFILVLLDLTQIINKVSGWELQAWFPIAIKNYLRKKERSLSSMAVILTKCDQLAGINPAQLQDPQGFYWNLIQQHAPLCTRLFNKVKFFFIAAVSNPHWDNVNHIWSPPSTGITSWNLDEVLDWIVDSKKKQLIVQKKTLMFGALSCGHF